MTYMLKLHELPFGEDDVDKKWKETIRTRFRINPTSCSRYVLDLFRVSAGSAALISHVAKFRLLVRERQQLVDSSCYLTLEYGMDLNHFYELLADYAELPEVLRGAVLATEGKAVKAAENRSVGLVQYYFAATAAEKDGLRKQFREPLSQELIARILAATRRLMDMEGPEDQPA